MEIADDRGESHIEEYMKVGFPVVEGWCHQTLADVAGHIDRYQRQSGARGGIAEVGVHHGKFLMLLNSFCDKTEESYAIDLFEHQELNVDHSGSGSLQVLKQNLSKYDRHSGANIKVISGDSLTLDFKGHIQHPVRMFSVDGGHTVEHTISDLRNAHASIHPNGIVILDDILNSHWLGVIEGAVLFLRNRPTLIPVAIGFNKLFLANFSYAQTYRELFSRHQSVTKYPVAFCGSDLVALG